MANILAVDDENAILNMIENVLVKDSHTVTKIDDPTKIEMDKLSHFDLILLDVMMPGIDGFELCSKIRNVVDCPILFITAKTDEGSLVNGLALGADDYICKPFGVMELRARIGAHLRREKREHVARLALGRICFMLEARKMMIDEKEISLTKAEYDICEFLAKNRGQIFSKEQILEKEGCLPDAVIACVGGGSNAIGSFYNFISDKSVRLIGCEAAGRGIDTFETAATINTGRLGIFHGMKSYFCQDEYGQIAPVYSISAGLDYPGIGPEHAYLHDIGRAEYVPVTDDEAVNAFEYLSRIEGIIPAIESAHAVAHAMKIAPAMDKDKIIVINISGRGDKDCAAIARYRGEDIHE